MKRKKSIPVFYKRNRIRKYFQNKRKSSTENEKVLISKENRFLLKHLKSLKHSMKKERINSKKLLQSPKWKGVTLTERFSFTLII